MTSPRLWGYVSKSIFDEHQQKAHVEGVAKRLGLPVHEIVVEHPAYLARQWDGRREMTRLLDGLEPGDHVVFAEPWVACWQIAHLPPALYEILVGKKAHVHFADFGGIPMDIAPESGRLLVQLIRGMLDVINITRKVWNEYHREVTLRQRPLPGYRFEKNEDGIRTQVLCPEQSALVRELYDRREAGESFKEIADDFMRRRLYLHAHIPWVRLKGKLGDALTGMEIRVAYDEYKKMLADGFDVLPGQTRPQGVWKKPSRPRSGMETLREFIRRHPKCTRKMIREKSGLPPKFIKTFLKKRYRFRRDEDGYWHNVPPNQRKKTR